MFPDSYNLHQPKRAIKHRRKTVQTDLAAAVAVVGSCGKSAVWQAAAARLQDSPKQ